MDIQVARFRDVLELLKPVILRKTNLPALTYFLLKEGKAVATDSETMVIVCVPESDIECLIPFADASKMLQYVRGMETLHIKPSKGSVTMSWTDGSSTFLTKDVMGFPSIPEFIPIAEASIDIDSLIPVMSEVQSFASTDDARPTLGGITMILGESIELAAGDGFQMAYKALPLSFPQEGTLVLPQASVIALKLLWEKTPRTPPESDALIPAIMAKKHASISLDGKAGLRFVFGDETTAIVKLIQGNPPAWTKLLPKDKPSLQVSFMGPQLELAVRRVLRIAMEGDKIVRLEFDENMVKVSAKSGGQEIQSTIKLLVFSGAPNKVALNASYLLSYLKGKDGIVSLSWTKDGAPIAFGYQKGPTVLIMPMQVKWDDDEPVEVAPAEEPPEPEEDPAAETNDEPAAEASEEPVDQVDEDPTE